MSLEQLERYVDYIDYLDMEIEIPFDEVLERYMNSSSDERIKMLFEVDGQTREKIKSLIDGGII